MGASLPVIVKPLSAEKIDGRHEAYLERVRVVLIEDEAAASVLECEAAALGNGAGAEA